MLKVETKYKLTISTVMTKIWANFQKNVQKKAKTR